LKVSIGSKFVEGPYGGGNLFVKNLSKYLIKKGVDVVYDLSDVDIDIILIINPLKSSEMSTFNHLDAYYYKQFVNKESMILHRINECDERKLTKGLNDFYMKANEIADHTVFVSTWISNIYKNLGMDKEKFTVILGGGDSSVFYFKNKKKWNKNEKLKLVTHHWSSNKNKGFEVYSKLDSILNKNPYKNTVEFTYIGNFTKEHNFKNIKFIPPLHGNLLANELKKHHIYITASINEPSGNHHMEAAMCRLPILYINSGALPEYCKEVGIVMNEENLEDKIIEMEKKYDIFYENLLNYKWDFGNAYIELMEILKYIDLNRDLILKRRLKSTKIRILINYFYNKVCVLTYKRFQKIRIVLGKIKRYVLR